MSLLLKPQRIVFFNLLSGKRLIGPQNTTQMFLKVVTPGDWDWEHTGWLRREYESSCVWKVCVLDARSHLNDRLRRIWVQCNCQSRGTRCPQCWHAGVLFFCSVVNAFKCYCLFPGWDLFFYLKENFNLALSVPIGQGGKLFKIKGVVHF